MIAVIYTCAQLQAASIRITYTKLLNDSNKRRHQFLRPAQRSAAIESASAPAQTFLTVKEAI